MNFDKETLKLIQETAVKASRAEVYEINPRRHLRVDAITGEKTYIDKDAPEMKNVVYTIDDAIRIFRSNADATIWVSERNITVLHNTEEQLGRTTIEAEKSNAADILLTADYKNEGTSLSPDDFEKIAKLRFWCSPAFIQTLRNLQWDTEKKETEQISVVHKSMSASALSRVLQKDGMPFEDVSITVTTPIFDSPIKTTDVEIKVSVLANAREKKITFAPEPGVLAGLVRSAVHELYEAVCEHLTEKEQERVYMGII